MSSRLENRLLSCVRTNRQANHNHGSPVTPSCAEKQAGGPAEKCARLFCLLFELDPAYSGNAIDVPNEVDASQGMTYVDNDTFLAGFEPLPKRFGS
jgi:hypothetical protein